MYFSKERFGFDLEKNATEKWQNSCRFIYIYIYKIKNVQSHSGRHDQRENIQQKCWEEEKEEEEEEHARKQRWNERNNRKVGKELKHERKRKEKREKNVCQDSVRINYSLRKHSRHRDLPLRERERELNTSFTPRTNTFLLNFVDTMEICPNEW